MAFLCRQCNHIALEAGVCPVCNIPMDIKLQDDMTPGMDPATDAPATEAPVEAPATDAPAEAPMEAPAETPMEVPAETPVEAPAAPTEGGEGEMA